MNSYISGVRAQALQPCPNRILPLGPSRYHPRNLFIAVRFDHFALAIIDLIRVSNHYDFIHLRMGFKDINRIGQYRPG